MLPQVPLFQDSNIPTKANFKVYNPTPLISTKFFIYIRLWGILIQDYSD